MGCQHSTKRDEELGTMSHDTYATNYSRTSRNSYSSVTSLAGPPLLSPKSGAPWERVLRCMMFTDVQLCKFDCS